MKSIFARSMRIFAGALFVTAAATNACAEARSRHTRSGDALIEELGAPNGKGFDDIVVKLAPLVPAKPAKDAPPAERPSAPIAAPEPPAVSVAAPPPSDSATPAPVAPVFLREPLPVIDSAPAEEIAKSAEPNIVAAPRAPEAVAPAEAPVETMAEAPIETKPETPVELSREAAEPSAPAQTTDPEKSEAPAVAEADPASADPAAEPARPQAEEQQAQEESESPLAIWQALVAALALVGLLASKYVRRAQAPSEVAARKPTPAKTAEVAPAGSAQKAPTGRFAALGARIGAARAKIEVIRAKVAALRGDRKTMDRPPAPAAAPNAAPEKPKALEWTKAVTALRQRLGGAKPAAASAAHEPRRMLSLVGTQPTSREADAWASSEEDGPELLEPGDASARAIVMNARRRLRAAQS
ncbi:hypothetical protein [Methylosinus sp. Ce-a6]|uniref:hypothetical protein n=1 Tax=Methylosinus sp. Ce-a6 TaxID=2172005 RepID=UPI001357DF37|nr:hypothetical protein [Methylosinus sp. Ce-a6]